MTSASEIHHEIGLVSRDQFVVRLPVAESLTQEHHSSGVHDAHAVITRRGIARWTGEDDVA